MAPVPPVTRGPGVPGEIEQTPGPAHSYRLRAGSRRMFATMKVPLADPMTSGAEPGACLPTEMYGLKPVAFNCMHCRRLPVPFASSYPKFPKRKTKRGLYVYKN